jgi:uncharacterized membrane protein
LLVSALVLSFLFFTLEPGGKYSSLATVLSVFVLLATVLAGFSYFVRLPSFMFYALVITLLGISLRISSVFSPPGVSDVLAASVEGARLILADVNPYTSLHHVGPSNIFAYPPLDPIFYIPFTAIDPRWAEVLSGSFMLVILLVVSLRIKRSESLLYLALYSFSPLLTAFVAASTNDTSASLFPFLGTGLLMFSNPAKVKHFDLAGVLFGLGVAFKQFGVFPLIFTLAYLFRSHARWLRFLIISCATVLVISLPFLILSPLNFLYQVAFFHVATRLPSPYFVVWGIYPEMFGLYSLLFQVLLSSIAGLFLLVRSKGWVECQIGWTTTMLLFLFLGRYFAASYFAYVMPFWILAGYMALAHRRNSVGRRSIPGRF